ncbi:MAG: hypothetical protein GAK45_02070 [Pseudomonas citronellolis]|nr:MAG: hypothetical protein GAK45_02070 [Pseudomonas citronellolis]
MFLSRAFLLAPLLLGGCAFLPHNEFYQPPPEQPDSAWLRIVGNTVWSSLYVGEGDTDGYFFETPLVPGQVVKVNSTASDEDVGMLCYIPVSFVPKAGHYYQITMFVNRYDYCRVVPAEIVRGEGGEWRIIPFKDVTYENLRNPDDPGREDMPPAIRGRKL